MIRDPVSILVGIIAMTKILILGGCGFVGTSLSHFFSSNDPNNLICLVDLHLPSSLPPTSHNINYRQADLTQISQLEKVFSEFLPHVVIHLASWGMSGSPMLDPKCHEINIQGTKNAVELCQRFNTQGFIYTSTYNVIFGGREIVNGDEAIPYFPLESHPDQYGPSKAVAEQLTLSANGTKTANGSTLVTCSLRPAAIYGPNELRHFPRIVSIMDSGLFVILIGSAVVDWVHIDNLVSAYHQAVRQIISSPSPAIAGQAYFISDGSPINQNEFLRPLCEARGVPFPSLHVPVPLMMLVAYLLERVHLLGKMSGLYSYEPFMTRSEVNKVAVTHYFSIDKAKRDLGYRPTITSQEGSNEIGEKYRQSLDNFHFFRLTHPLLAFLILSGMATTALFAFDSPDTVYSNPILSSLKGFSYGVFQSQRVIQGVFYAATLTHVLEAFVALKVSSELKCCQQKQFLWFIQTLLYGYGSLGMLYERKDWLKNQLKKQN